MNPARDIMVMICKWYCCKDVNASAFNFKNIEWTLNTEHSKSKTPPFHTLTLCGIEQNSKQKVIFWIRIGGGVVGGPSPSSTFQLMSKLCRSFSIFDNYLLALFRQHTRPTYIHTFLVGGKKGGMAWKLEAKYCNYSKHLRSSDN